MEYYIDNLLYNIQLMYLVQNDIHINILVKKCYTVKLHEKFKFIN